MIIVDPRTESFESVAACLGAILSAFQDTQDITALIQGGWLGKYENARTGIERCNVVLDPGDGLKTLASPRRMIRFFAHR